MWRTRCAAAAQVWKPRSSNMTWLPRRYYDGYPDVGLQMISSRTFDGRIQLLEYAPTVLDKPADAKIA
jgi:hypothetical protein